MQCKDSPSRKEGRYKGELIRYSLLLVDGDELVLDDLEIYEAPGIFFKEKEFFKDQDFFKDQEI